VRVVFLCVVVDMPALWLFCIIPLDFYTCWYCSRGSAYKYYC